uniref:BSD domain-containing protein n=1 Tax=Timema shepardi TaxID=629360 RepID=A0A7R9AXB4_TIMSH|nr:unnamed protein product [Timema shepardi]
MTGNMRPMRCNCVVHLVLMSSHVTLVLVVGNIFPAFPVLRTSNSHYRPSALGNAQFFERMRSCTTAERAHTRPAMSMWLTTCATEIASMWLTTCATETASMWLTTCATEIASMWLTTCATEMASMWLTTCATETASISMTKDRMDSLVMKARRWSIEPPVRQIRAKLVLIMFFLASRYIVTEPSCLSVNMWTSCWGINIWCTINSLALYFGGCDVSWPVFGAPSFRTGCLASRRAVGGGYRALEQGAWQEGGRQAGGRWRVPSLRTGCLAGRRAVGGGYRALEQGAWQAGGRQAGGRWRVPSLRTGCLAGRRAVGGGYRALGQGAWQAAGRWRVPSFRTGCLAAGRRGYRSDLPVIRSVPTSRRRVACQCEELNIDDKLRPARKLHGFFYQSQLFTPAELLMADPGGVINYVRSYNFAKCQVSSSSGSQSAMWLYSSVMCFVSSSTTDEMEHQLEIHGSLLGEFNKEQEAFIKEKQGKNSDAAVPPWVGCPNENSLKEECLTLSTDRRNFVRSPPAGVEFQFDYEVTYPVAMATLAEDPNLEKMRFELVPKSWGQRNMLYNPNDQRVCCRINEETFWRNYFYRISLIRQANELSSMAESQVSSRINSMEGEPAAFYPHGKMPVLGVSGPALGIFGPAMGVSGPALGIFGPAMGVPGPALGLSGCGWAVLFHIVNPRVDDVLATTSDSPAHEFVSDTFRASSSDLEEVREGMKKLGMDPDKRNGPQPKKKHGAQSFATSLVHRYVPTIN